MPIACIIIFSQLEATLFGHSGQENHSGSGIKQWH